MHTTREVSKSTRGERLVSYCQTASASTAPCTSRRMCCPTHCASYCAPCQPLLDVHVGRQMPGYRPPDSVNFPRTRRDFGIFLESGPLRTIPPGHLWRDKWTAPSGPLSLPVLRSTQWFELVRRGHDEDHRTVEKSDIPSGVQKFISQHGPAPHPRGPPIVLRDRHDFKPRQLAVPRAD